MKIKQSDTIIIKRSQINFAPYNPRKKDAKVVEKLRKNFRKVGFLGGIVWNERTGNLVGGHKRTEALDLIHGYDGTAATDYEIKVERIDVDEKTEKEQNIFLNSKNAQGEMDFELLADIIGDIDIEAAAISDYDISIIESIVPNFTLGDNSDIVSDINKMESVSKEQREQTKQKRKEMRNGTSEKRLPFYFTVTFDSYDLKAEFLESIGINGDDVFITGERFVKQISE